MAKRKTRKRKGMKPWEIGVIGVLVVAAAYGGWSWWRSGAAEKEFLALAAAGGGGLSAVVTKQGSGGHLRPGQQAGYRDRMPTAGAHDPKWVNPGVYGTPQPPTKLVHSLEHGMVVVYYDKPQAPVRETIESWPGLYAGMWSGVVVAPMPGLGEEVVLTAWQKTLRLKSFDEAAAAAFVDRYRGRGPENAVR